MSRAALAADEIIELGQGAPPAGASEEALAEVRGVIDAWQARFSKEATKIIVQQSRLARNESVLGVWGRELAAIGSLAAGATLVGMPAAEVLNQLAQLDDGEQWEATRRLSFRLLNESQKFAGQYGGYFTDEQFKLGNMLDKQLLSAIDAAEQWKKAIRPELIQAVLAFEAAVAQVFVDVARQLGDILKKIGLTVIAVPGLAFDLMKWLREHLGTILLVGGITAAAVVGLVLYSALRPAAAALPARGVA